ncbi:cytochrome P450 [Hypoxylon sp. FL1150]|nr:cytochrome P450 [Hypoxylon sp. FL1150]
MNLLRVVVRRKHTELREKEGETPNNAGPSLGLEDITTLTSSVVDETCGQLRTFLFAGRDTTTILLSWVIYELSRTPHALRAVRAELDSLLSLDASPGAVQAQLLERPDLVQQMPYISAVINQGLRLHPPGCTARKVPAGSGFTVRLPNGQQECLGSLHMYACQSIIHRDPNGFGDIYGKDFW